MDLRYNIDRTYKESLSCYEKKLSKYENLLTSDTIEYSVEFENKTFKIWYRSNVMTQRCEYTKKEVKQFNIFSKGCLIIFKDKKYIFIPATDNDDKNEFLIDFCEEVRKTLGDLKIGTAQRLALPDGEGGKYHVGSNMFDSPITFIIVALLSAVVGYVFFIGGDDYKDVTREDCIEYTGVVANIDNPSWYDDDDFCDLEFEDGELYTVEGKVISEDVKQALKTISAGDTVTLLFYEEQASVMEVTNEGETILPFEWAYKQYNLDAVVFYWMGIGIWAGDIFLLGYGISGIIREKKEKE